MSVSDFEGMFVLPLFTINQLFTIEQVLVSLYISSAFKRLRIIYIQEREIFLYLQRVVIN
jgi:hypothetical protein